MLVYLRSTWQARLGVSGERQIRVSVHQCRTDLAVDLCIYEDRIAAVRMASGRNKTGRVKTQVGEIALEKKYPPSGGREQQSNTSWSIQSKGRSLRGPAARPRPH